MSEELLAVVEFCAAPTLSLTLATERAVADVVVFNERSFVFTLDALLSVFVARVLPSSLFGVVVFGFVAAKTEVEFPNLPLLPLLPVRARRDAALGVALVAGEGVALRGFLARGLGRPRREGFAGKDS